MVPWTIFGEMLNLRHSVCDEILPPGWKRRQPALDDHGVGPEEGWDCDIDATAELLVKMRQQQGG